MRSEIGLAHVSDGSSSTYLVGEKFLRPAEYYLETNKADNETMYAGFDNDNHRITYVPGNKQYLPPLLNTDAYSDGVSFGSPHPAALHFVFCDGSVHTISYGIDPEIHRRLSTRNGNETIDLSILQ